MKTGRLDERPWFPSYDKEVLIHQKYPRIPLYGFLEKSALEFPEKVCTIFENHEIKYRDIWKYAISFAESLIDLGCKKGDRVGIALSNSPSFVIAFYGILKTGGVVVAINPLYKESEFGFILNNADVEILVCQDNHQDLLNKLSQPSNLRVAIISSASYDNKILSDYENEISSDSIDNEMHVDPAKRYEKIDSGFSGLRFINFLQLVKSDEAKDTSTVVINDNDPAVFQYSGGTTGIPKAAIGYHRNLVANTIQFRSWLWKLKDGQETVLAAIPLYHVYGMVICLSVGISLGASLVIEEDPRNLDSLLSNIESHRPTLFPCVPNLFSAIIQKEKTASRKFDLSSIKICISGSAPLLPTVKEEFEKLTSGKVLEGYGLSEAPTATHCNPLNGDNKPGSIGLPLPDVDCRLIPYWDNEGSQEDIDVGELLIRGPQVMAGYHNAGDIDNEIIKDGWLYTGDIAKYDQDGYFYILGRKKDLIKIGGFQVWPTEIEEVISKHPAVKEVCVAGVPGSDGNEVVKAWVILKDGFTSTTEEIQEWVKARLVNYKSPGLVEFRTNLPKTFVGKTLRRELVREYLEKISKV